MEFTTADCVKLMPEWNGLALDIRELKGGITNQLYRVDVRQWNRLCIQVLR